MFEVILWPPVLVPLSCFCAGALSPKIWIGLFLAELFSILGIGFFYVVAGGSLPNDALSVSTFLIRFFFSLPHALVLALFSASVLAGHLVRGFVVTKSGHGQPST